MLQESCCVKWLQQGNRNTSFIQSLIKVQKVDKCLETLSINGMVTHGKKFIESEIIYYFY